MGIPLKLLLVEDSEDDAILLLRELRKGGYEPVYQIVDCVDDLIAALKDGEWDIAMVDYSLPGFCGLQALEILQQHAQYLPAIMVSGVMGEEKAVGAMKAGANDYIIKGNYSRLVPAVERELREAKVWQERRAAQEELRKSEARYRAIVEDQTDFIYRCTLEGVITFVNEAYARLYGFSPTELIGVKHERFLPAEELAKLVDVQSRLRQENPIVSNEIRHQLPGGEEICIQWVDRLIFDAEGKPVEYQGVGRDITEIRRATEELKTFAENLERYATQLQVAAAIARDTATTPDLEGLLSRATELVREHFGFYHTGIFLLDEAREYAVLRAAASIGGQKLLEKGHKLKVGGEGIVGYVAATGQPRIALDVSSDSLHLRQPLLHATRSEMAVPLKINDKVIGVFDVQSRRQAAFDGNDLIVLQTLADQLTVAIENIRLVSEARRRSEELRGLYETALATSSVLDTSTLLQRLYEQVQRLLNPDTFVVVLYESKSETFCVALAMEGGEPVEEFVHKRFPVTEGGLTGWVLQQRQTLHVGDVTEDKLPVPPIHGSVPTRSWLGVPLMARGYLVGVVSVQSFRPRAFTAEDQRFLESLAAQSAVALENARLFEAERAARKQAEALREVAQVVGARIAPNEILESILAQLRTILAYDSASVLLIDSRGQLGLIAVSGYQDKPTVVREAGKILEQSPILAKMAQDLQPVIIPDVHQHPDWIWVPGAEYIRSFLAVPIVSRESMIGALMVDNCAPNFYAEDDLGTVQALAQHMAVALENASLFEAAEKRAHELEILRRVSLSLTASLETKAVLDAVLSGVFRLIPQVGDAHIFLYDGERLSFGAALFQDGRRGEIYSTPRPDGLTYTVARTGQTIQVDDFQTHPLYEDIAREQKWFGSIIGIPVKIGERVVGVINVAHPETHAFSPDELRALSLLSDQAALAIENARLFEQTTTERRHLNLLYDVGQALAGSLEPDVILERALELICQALGVEGGAAWFTDREDRRLALCSLYSQRITPLDELPPESEMHLELGVGTLGKAAQNRQTVHIPDLKQADGWFRIPGLENPRSVIVAPLYESDDLLGVIAVFHRNVDAFGQDQVDLVQTICHQVGLALSNARRYQDTNHLADLLKAEQRRLETLIEMLPVGVLLLGENYRLLMANPLGREILGVLSPTTSGHEVTRLGEIPMDELLRHQDDPLPLTITIDQPYHGVFEAQARRIGGESVQWVLTLRDVTQERKIQKHIQMQNRLATVGQLAAGIAHDFNNIMAAIVVYTDLLQLDQSISPQGREKLSIIQQQVQRASSLIRQILDFSRRSVMEQQPMDLLPLLREISKLLERTLPETIRVEFRYQPDDYMVMADPTRLQQVFMNLAVNARDAMPQGGKLRFEIDRFHLSWEGVPPVMNMPAGEWVRIVVADTGIGISDEHLTHIFEPFFTTKPIGEGTGLGLAQVYGIIRQHEGFITVDSRVNQGTRFTVYLPAHNVLEIVDPSPDGRQQIDGRGKTVLLVEDDDSTREALKALLDAHQFRVLMASDGLEAVHVLEKKHDTISLVVSDIVMPEMGGMELYTTMQARWPDLRMLFITGHPLDPNDQVVLEDGRVSWMLKPFSVHEFTQALRDIFEQAS